jgi:hypothetical protein
MLAQLHEFVEAGAPHNAGFVVWGPMCFVPRGRFVSSPAGTRFRFLNLPGTRVPGYNLPPLRAGGH